MLAAFLFASCTGKSTGPTDSSPVDSLPKDPDTVVHAIYGAYGIDSGFYSGVKLGLLSPTTLVEASGLAASRSHPGMLWTHNDSGNPNYVFLIDSTAVVRATYSLDGCANRDWEDIAIGPGPVPGQNYIYVGEIGDNKAKNPSSFVYRFIEPSGALDTTGALKHITSIDKINFVYPDGPHNAETLMVDPLTKDIYIASKGPVVNLYVARYPQPVDSLFTAKELATLPLSTLTAGDISPSGSEIVMRNYVQIYYWKKAANQTISMALQQTPELLPYSPEAQGEAICWSPNGDAYYTTSEYANNVVAPLFIYRRK